MTQKYEGVYSQKIEKKPAAWFNIKTLNFLLVAVIVVGSLYYVTGINDLVIKSFTLQQLKAKAALLQDENQSLNAETASLKSYKNLASRIAGLKMVAVDNVDYLKVGSGVAMAR